MIQETMKNQNILVVGSFVQDLTFATQRFPRPGETVVGEFLTGPGGKGSNQAVAARRAGVACTFIGAVGEDAFARSVREFYQKEGIEAPLAVYPESSTGTAGILFDASGQNEIVVALGANDLIQPKDIPDAVIEKSELVVCQFECNLPTVKDVLQRARKYKRTTVLNPAPLRADLDLDILRYCDLLIPNESECCALLKAIKNVTIQTEEVATMKTEELDKLCRLLGPEIVLVTLGSKGVHISTPDFCQRISAVEGIQAVDTTGAGDAFVGSFATAFLRYDKDVRKAAEFANSAAALSVTRKGTAPAMAYQNEIEKLLLEQS